MAYGNSPVNKKIFFVNIMEKFLKMYLNTDKYQCKYVLNTTVLLIIEQVY